MSLESLLSINNSREVTKNDISEERLDACMDALREQIAFYRAYPDIFVDNLIEAYNADADLTSKCTFSFFYYQRLVLRAAMRHRKTYFIFSRGFSKSFLSMMSLMLKAILYPGVELFITTGGKARMACAVLS